MRKLLFDVRIGLVLGLFIILVLLMQYRNVSESFHKVKSALEAQNAGNELSSGFEHPSDTVENSFGPLNLSHPLENSCKYPILNPHDLNLRNHVRHLRKLVCPKVQPEFSWIDSEGYLTIQEDPTADKKLTKSTPRCFYRPFAGSLKPKITTIEWLAEQKRLHAKYNGTKIWIPEDQFEIQCFAPGDDVKKKKYIYRYAHAHIGERKDLNPVKVSDTRLGLDILVLDSISLNQLRRHMIASWPYMRDVMGFEWFEGYNKVADNSMVNLFPILAGFRYVNQSADMPSDILPATYDHTMLNLENFTFIWNLMKNKGCATMLNDAIGHHTRGLFHYPWKNAKGFTKKPTDYYFRPWYVSNYRWPPSNLSGELYFGNHPLHLLHTGLMEQFMRKYHRHCHFSFNFLTALSHNDPNYIELMDEDLKSMLERLYTKNRLNNTALVVLGDHGNRVSAIRYAYVGRLEERLPFLGIYLPKWFKQRHPSLLRNLRVNRQRLTSNFDLHQTLLDIVNERYDDSPREKVPGRGLSLFGEIPAKRTCRDAGIPVQYCTCLQKRNDWIHFDNEIHTRIRNSLVDHFRSRSVAGKRCRDLVSEVITGNMDDLVKVELLKSERFTVNDMVRQGIRYQNDDELKELKKPIKMDIEYIEITARISPFEIQVKARFQNENSHPERFRMNVEPLILKGNEKCTRAKSFEDFCRMC